MTKKHLVYSFGTGAVPTREFVFCECSEREKASDVADTLAKNSPVGRWFCIWAPNSGFGRPFRYNSGVLERAAT